MRRALVPGIGAEVGGDLAPRLVKTFENDAESLRLVQRAFDETKGVLPRRGAGFRLVPLQRSARRWLVGGLLLQWHGS